MRSSVSTGIREKITMETYFTNVRYSQKQHRLSENMNLFSSLTRILSNQLKSVTTKTHTETSMKTMTNQFSKIAAMLFTFVLFLVATTAFTFEEAFAQQTYYVDTGGNDNNNGLSPTLTGGNGPFKSIDSALVRAVAGDTISVEAGNYTSFGSGDISTVADSVTFVIRQDASSGATIVAIDTLIINNTNIKFLAGTGTAYVASDLQLLSGNIASGANLITVSVGAEVRIVDGTIDASAGDINYGKARFVHYANTTAYSTTGELPTAMDSLSVTGTGTLTINKSVNTGDYTATASSTILGGATIYVRNPVSPLTIPNAVTANFEISSDADVNIDSVITGSVIIKLDTLGTTNSIYGSGGGAAFETGNITVAANGSISGSLNVPYTDASNSGNIGNVTINGSVGSVNLTSSNNVGNLSLNSVSGGVVVLAVGTVGTTVVTSGGDVNGLSITSASTGTVTNNGSLYGNVSILPSDNGAALTYTDSDGSGSAIINVYGDIVLNASSTLNGASGSLEATGRIDIDGSYSGTSITTTTDTLDISSASVTATTIAASAVIMQDASSITASGALTVGDSLLVGKVVALSAASINTPQSYLYIDSASTITTTGTGSSGNFIANEIVVDTNAVVTVAGDSLTTQGSNLTARHSSVIEVTSGDLNANSVYLDVDSVIVGNELNVAGNLTIDSLSNVQTGRFEVMDSLFMSYNSLLYAASASTVRDYIEVDSSEIDASVIFRRSNIDVINGFGRISDLTLSGQLNDNDVFVGQNTVVLDDSLIVSGTLIHSTTQVTTGILTAGTISNNGTFIVGDHLQVTSSVTNAGSFTTNANVDITGYLNSTGFLYFSDDTVSIGANFTNEGTFTANSTTSLDFTGSGASTFSPGPNFTVGNITLSKAGSVTMTNDVELSAAGGDSSLTVRSGATLNMGNFTASVIDSSVVNSAGTITNPDAAVGGVYLTHNGIKIAGTGYANISVGLANKEDSVVVSDSTDFSGTLSIIKGAIVVDNGQDFSPSTTGQNVLLFPENNSVLGAIRGSGTGTFNAAGNSYNLTFDGALTSNYTIQDEITGDVNNVTVSTTGDTLYLGGDRLITGNLTVEVGAKLFSQDDILTVGGTLNVPAGASLKPYPSDSLNLILTGNSKSHVFKDSTFKGVGAYQIAISGDNSTLTAGYSTIGVMSFDLVVSGNDNTLSEVSTLTGSITVGDDAELTVINIGQSRLNQMNTPDSIYVGKRATLNVSEKTARLVSTLTLDSLSTIVFDTLKLEDNVVALNAVSNSVFTNINDGAIKIDSATSINADSADLKRVVFNNQTTLTSPMIISERADINSPLILNTNADLFVSSNVHLNDDISGNGALIIKGTDVFSAGTASPVSISNLVFDAGSVTFTGNNITYSIDSSFTHTAGNIALGSNILQFNGDYTHSAGTYTGGQFHFKNGFYSNKSFSGSPVFTHVVYELAGDTITYAAGSTPTISDKIDLNTGVIDLNNSNTGIIYNDGVIVERHSALIVPSTANVRRSDTSDRITLQYTSTGNLSTGPEMVDVVDSLRVSKFNDTDTVTFTENVAVRSFFLQKGSIAAGDSVTFDPSGSTLKIESPAGSYNGSPTATTNFTVAYNSASSRTTGDEIANDTVNVTSTNDLTLGGSIGVRNLEMNNGSTLSMSNDTLSLKGDITFASGSSLDADSTNALVAFVGASAQTMTLDTDENISNVQINNASGVTLSGANLTVPTLLTLNQGLFNLSGGSVTLTQGVNGGQPTQGFDRSLTTPTSVSHIVNGSVKKSIVSGETLALVNTRSLVEFPVGTINPKYRPLTFYFNNNPSTSFTLDVSHVESSPNGGQFNEDASAAGVVRYPDFYWTVNTDVSLSENFVYEVHAEANGFTLGNNTNIEDVKMIHRSAGNPDENYWNLLATNYVNANEVPNGYAIVRAKNAEGALRSNEQYFTLGLPSGILYNQIAATEISFAGDSVVVDTIANVFTASNPLTYTFTTSNYVDVDTTNGLLKISAKQNVTTPVVDTLTITASDNFESRVGTYYVTVNPQVYVESGDEISDKNYTLGQTAQEIDLTQLFSGGTGSITLSHTNTSNATSTAITSDTLTVSMNAVGTDTITVTGTDSRSSSNTFTFYVSVSAAPTVDSTFADVETSVGGNTVTVDISASRFGNGVDPKTVTFATLNDSSVAKAVRTGDALNLEPRAAGTDTVIITATDVNGVAVADSFEVVVNPQVVAPSNRSYSFDLTSEFNDSVFAFTGGNGVYSFTVEVTGTSLDTAFVESGSQDTLHVEASSAANAGTSTVKVTAVDAYGSSAFFVDTVTVTYTGITPPAGSVTVADLTDDSVVVSVNSFSTVDAQVVVDSVVASDVNKATVELSGDKSTYTVTFGGLAVANDSVLVTVYASDRFGDVESYTDTIKVDYTGISARVAVTDTVDITSDTYTNSTTMTTSDGLYTVTSVESSVPSIARIDSNNGSAYFVTLLDDGVANITVTAEDRFGTVASFTDTLVVTRVPQTPTWVTGLPDTTIYRGAAFSFTYNAETPEGNDVVYRFTGTQPSSSTLDSVSGSFTWTPETDGEFIFRVSAYNVADKTLSSDDVATVTVVETPIPLAGPEFTVGLDTANIVSDSLLTVTYTASAQTELNAVIDTMYIAADTVAGASFSFSDVTKQGTLTISRSIDSVGTFEFDVIVEDNRGLKDTTHTVVNVTMRYAFGDPTGNGAINANDAVAILRHVVGLDTLVGDEIYLADVTGNGSISALDAAYILKSLVDPTFTFPVVTGPAKSVEGSGTLDWSLIENTDEENMQVELSIVNSVRSVNSITFEVTYDPETSKLSSIEHTLPNAWMIQHHDNGEGLIKIAMIGATSINQAMSLGTVTFEKVNKDDISTISAIGQVNDLTMMQLEDIDLKVLPAEFALLQNYPNPFNPSTTISYQLPVDANVKITVYNMLGQQVAVLVNEMKSAGTYNLTFDMSQFASGAYFYRIQANEFISIKSMTLIK